MLGSVRPRDQISCFITFIARETAVQMRYRFTPGIAQRRTERTPAICGIESEAVPRELNEHYGKARNQRALRHREENREMKQRPAPCAFAGHFRARNEGDDRVVEAEHPDLAQDVGRRPRDQKYP